ncbi:MAG: magnesium transporter [Gammaproteobacteria bacterium]|nr:magnesium transporter [Gammaproteobacteria bacterium]
MNQESTEPKTEFRDELNHLLGQRDEAGIARLIADLHPAQLADLLESLPHDERAQVWDLTDPDKFGDVLLFVNDAVRSGLIERLDEHALIAATGNLEADDLADILPDLPGSVISEILQSMDEQDRQRLETVLKYPEDTAGGLMNVDTVTVRPDVSLEVVLRYLRYRASLPDMTDKLFVVNRQDIYQGYLSLADLVSKDPELTVADVLSNSIDPITVDTEDGKVAHLFEKLDLVSAPVVDTDGKLLGRITIDDVVDVIREEADHTIMSRAGLDEEDDMFAPVVRSTQRRTVWLGVNLLTALLASWVIGLFDATIEQLVALAVLMPVVASMGGIAGSQTLTLVIRGLALGKIGTTNQNLLLKKELSVGALNGVMWATVIGFVAYVWFESVGLGIIIGLAILANLIVAAFSGATIPLLLKRFGADPALAGSVVLTTVTDVVGFFVFLGLAAVFLV